MNVIFLGGSFVGIKTIFKQIQIIYGNGFSPEELRSFIHQIRENIIFDILELVNSVKSLPSEYEQIAREIKKINLFEFKFTPELGMNIQKLWNSTEIQLAFQEPRSLEFGSNAS